MSWLDSSIETNEAASQDQRLERTSEKLKPTFFQGGYDALGQGLVRGVIEGGATLKSAYLNAALTGGPEQNIFDYTQSTTLSPEAQTDINTDLETTREETAQAVSLLRPDPNEVGTAGQIIGEAAAILPRTVLASVVAGPLAGAAAAGAPAGYSRRAVSIDEGIDEGTANLLGLTEGVTTGVGAALPAAGIAKSLLGDAAATVAANVGLGVAHRASSAAILESNGYTAQAAQYRAMDGTAVATDVIMGLAFFGIGRAGMRKPTTEQVDAALTERNAQHADIDTAPGAPVDPKSGMAHQDALRSAIDSINRGEQVALPDSIQSATFLRADDESPLAQGLARAVDEELGVDAKSLAGEFAARVGREAEYSPEGAPVFRDGTAYPLSEIGRFYDSHLATNTEKGAAVPDVLFSIGRMDDATTQGLHDYLPGFNENLREARISARAIKHIQESRPGIVREVLDRLERGVLTADEVLPNHQNPDRALLVLHDVDGGERAGAAKHQSTVIEISANGKGVDVVSAMTMPERTLNKARARKAELDESRAGGLHSPSSLADGQARQPHAAAASEDFPQVARDSDSIRSAGGDAIGPTTPEPPELQLLRDAVSRNPEAVVSSGYDADGVAVKEKASDVLAAIEAEHATGVKESQSYVAAITCMLRGA